MDHVFHHRDALTALVAQLEVLRPEDPDHAVAILTAVESGLGCIEDPESEPSTARLLADIEYVRGVLDHSRGDLHSAMKHFDEAIRIADRAGDEHRYVDALRQAALCYENAGRQTESTRMIVEALERADELGDMRRRALVSLTLCALYQAQGAWSALLGQAQRTREFADHTDDQHLRSRAYSGVGVALGYSGRPADGLEWIDRAESVLGGSGLPLESLFLNLNRMFLLRRAGHLDQCLALADQLPAEFRLIPAPDAARLAVMLADTVLAVGDHDRALELLTRAEETAGSHAMTAHLIDFHRVAARIHERRGAHEEALRSMREYVELDREIRGRRAEARLVDIERRYERELAKKSEEIHQLKNVELVEKNAALASLNRQKDDILSVLAHDLRNPLAAVHMLGDFLLSDAQLRNDRDAAEQLRSLGAAAAEMTRIIDDLLEQRGPATMNCVDAVSPPS